MMEVGAVDSDRWEEGGCTRANAMLLGVCVFGAVGRSRGRAVPIEEDVAFQCTDAPLAGGNPASHLNWYSKP